MARTTFRFVNRAGEDVTATADVAGYCVRDYFDRDVTDIINSHAPGEIRSLLRAAYRGRDADGIGVEWDVN